MATTRNSDVNLIIKARDEATRTIESVSQTLHGLYGTAEQAGTGVADLGKNLSALDKAYAAINGSANNAAQGIRRQEEALASNRARVSEYRTEVEQARRAVELLRTKIVDQVLAGQDQSKTIGQIRELEARIVSLTGSSSRLGRTIETQANALTGSRSAFQELGSITIATEQAQQKLRAELDRTTASTERNAKAVADAAAARARTAQTTQQTQEFFAPRAAATTGGATFSALDAAGRATEIREAAHVYELFEARVRLGAQALRDEAAAEKAADTEAKAQAVRDAAHAYELFEKRVRDGARALRETDEAEKRAINDAQTLRDKLDPLAATQRRFNEELIRYRDLAARGKISTNELAQAEKQLGEEQKKAAEALTRTNANRPKVSLFGLQPYETQNLFYQFNDIATQISSGTSLSQTLAQQGGQIFQLFQNRIGPAIAAAFTNPAFIGAAAVITAIALALGRAANEAERLRGINAGLALSSDGGLYDASKIEKSAEALRGYGANIDEATAALKIFTSEGVNPERLDAFGRAAQNLVDVTGVKLPEAAKQLATAFTGGYDSVAKLDDSLHFLTATQRDNIRALFEEGEASKARAIAFDLFTAKIDKAAAIQRGPATEATRSLKKGYDDLLDSLAHTDTLQAVVGFFGQIGDEISRATGKAAAFTTAADRIARINTLNREIADLITQDNLGPTIGGPAPFILRRAIQAKQSELKELQDQIKKEEADKNAAGADTQANDTQAQRAANIKLREAQDDLILQGQRRGQIEKGVTTEREKQLRLVVAERAARERADSIGGTDDAKNAFVAQARRNELDAIAKEDADARKAAKARREQAISLFESRVVGAEGGTAQNPFSSAKGFGQFTKDTFVDVYSRTPGADQSKSREQIVALRDNERIARGVLDQYARENARFLEKFGAQVTAGNLYLAHFLGAAGAKKVLTADGATPVDQLGLGAGVLRGNQGYLRTNNGKGRYRTADELEKFIANRVGDTGSAQTALVEEQNALIVDAKKKQDEFNLSVKQTTEERLRALDAGAIESRLSGITLLNQQKSSAIAAAELALRQKVEDANKNLKPGEDPVTVTPEQIARTRELTGALFDLSHAREAVNIRRDEAQRPLDTLNQQKDAVKQQAEFLRSIGDNEGANAAEAGIEAINVKIRAATQNLIDFYKNLDDNDKLRLGILDEAQLDRIIEKLRLGGQAAQEFGKVLGIDARQIAQAFASAATSAFTNFINKVAAGKNVFKSLASSVREFAAAFISSIAQMILQLLAYAAAVTILRALGVPIPNTNVIPLNHGGGIAGDSGGMRREVSPIWFAAATRYHNGGIAGLKPNEVPTILEAGEEVLTANDKRHRANGGLNNGGSAPQKSGDLTLINVNDPAQAMELALRTPAGQRVLINHVRDNQQAFKAALG